MICYFEQCSPETPPEGAVSMSNNESGRSRDLEIAVGGGEAPVSLTEVAALNVSY